MTINPTDSKNKLIVLDLDETLVFASEHPLERDADLRLADYHIYKRPYLDQFLDYVFENFTVGVWTSSGKLYAEPLVAEIMPARPLLFVWSAMRCSLARDWETGVYSPQKRLTKLKQFGFPLERIIGIDDTPEKYAKNYGNLVRVSEFSGDTEDSELLNLIEYLDVIRHTENIRKLEKRFWREQYDKQV